MPTSEEGVINYVGECNASRGYLCKLCEGDCDNDSDCEGNLICAQRSGFEAVDGCSGEGGTRDMESKDVCVNPQAPDTQPPTPVPTPDPTSPTTYIQNVGNPCSVGFGGGACQECTGDCDSDSDCDGDLRCAQRRGVEDVPGCAWDGSGNMFSGTDFCKCKTARFDHQRFDPCR